VILIWSASHGSFLGTIYSGFTFFVIVNIPYVDVLRPQRILTLRRFVEIDLTILIEFLGRQLHRLIHLDPPSIAHSRFTSASSSDLLGPLAQAAARGSKSNNEMKVFMLRLSRPHVRDTIPCKNFFIFFASKSVFRCFRSLLFYNSCAIKGVSIALSFRISLLLFKIQNQIDPQLAHFDLALPSVYPAFFAHASRH